MKNLNLIRKICWNYCKSNQGLDFEDICSEAMIAYLENKHKFNPEKGKESTFIWHVVSNHLNTLIKNKTTISQKEILLDKKLMEDVVKGNSDNPESPEQKYLASERWEEIFSSLSPEAQMVISFITQGEIYLQTDKPRQSRGVIARELKKKGWEPVVIWNTFRELKGVLN